MRTLRTRAALWRRDQTEAEAKLWAKLRAHRAKDVHFRRQFVNEKYIVDFCAVRKKLIIEVDGSQHVDQEEYDAERTVFLVSKDFCMLRVGTIKCSKISMGSCLLF